MLLLTPLLVFPLPPIQQARIFSGIKEVPRWMMAEGKRLFYRIDMRIILESICFVRKK